MAAFWTFVRKMARHRLMLASAISFALLSAFGLGVGLLSLAPVLTQIVHPESGKGLAELATEFNAAGHWFQFPDWFVGLLPTDQFDGVVLVLIFICILTIIGAVCNFTHQYLSQTLTTKAVAEFRAELFRKVVRLPLGLVVTRGPSEFIARLVRDAAALQQGLNALLSKTVAQVTKGLAALVVAIVYDWKIVIIALIVGPIIAVVLRKLAKRVRRGSKGSLAAQQEMLKHTTEIMHGLRAVKTSTAEQESEREFDEVNREVVKHELRMRLARAMSGPIVETLAILALSLLAVIASKSILSGSLPFDRFILSLGSLGVAGASFRPLAGIINEISAASAPAQRIQEILDEPIEQQGHDLPPLPRHNESIRFEHVHYTYPGADEPALQDVDLTVRFGERIAIVGPNGSGKTTLLGLLPRLLVPSAGRLVVDGFDASEVQLASLRSQVGVVTQESFIMNGTIEQNISFGADDVDQSAIRDAARIAHAVEFIEQLPDGWSTTVAEGGASLSGGQRQRLSIARALVRNPAILILDEATSQVDSESEVAIRDAINDAGIDRTMLIIAHRMASVITADRIVVMDGGRIVDVGSHDELLKRCELYARLTTTQLVGAEA